MALADIERGVNLLQESLIFCEDLFSGHYLLESSEKKEKRKEKKSSA